jgi:flagellar biosynthetic protein FlhB
MLLIGLASAAAVLAQTRFLVSKESLKFKFERLSFLKGIKKLFSLRSLVELFKSMIKISVMIYLLYANVRRLVGIVPSSMDWSLQQALSFTGGRFCPLRAPCASLSRRWHCWIIFTSAGNMKRTSA